MLFKKLPKLLVISFAFALLLLTVFAQKGNANPSNPGDDHSCHDVPGPYSITSINSSTLEVPVSGSFDVNVSATGPNLYVKIYSVAQDNSKFQVQPNDTIQDNSAYDQNSSTNGIIVKFTFTAPSTDGTYKILILALDPAITQPAFAVLEFTVNVGAGGGLKLNVFSHLSIYIGLAAVLCLAIGTILYEKNNQLTRPHGILAAIAFALTTINVIFVIPMTADTINSWAGGVAIDWMHLIHISFGIIGYGAGVIAMLTGFSGIRTKKPGYVALIFWTFNLIFGIIKWGIVF